MRTLTAVSRFFAALLSLSALQAMAQAPAALSSPKFYEWAQTPPMGWNSWDCFGAGVSEQDVLANAEYMEKNLKSHGWNIITVDIQWYEPLAHTDRYRRGCCAGNGRQRPAAPRR